MPTQKKQKTCENGHVFFKSSDCPICPICETLRKPINDFLAELVAPARRALENNAINSLETLATFSEKEVLKFHGMGKSSIPKLKKMLKEVDLKFKEE
jgi:DNA-directed RNA polymerase alpha subunit